MTEEADGMSAVARSFLLGENARAAALQTPEHFYQ